MPTLKITTGKMAGKTYDVTKPMIIGRGDSAQVQIADKNMSREHCKVYEQGGAWIVADLNSRNGFKVNGVQSTRKNLSHGDKIVVGDTTIEFEMTGGSAPKPAADAKKDKEAAFAAARAATAAPAKSSARAPAAAKAGGGEGSGLKVSDHVLQFHKVDVNKATVLDVDLAQSPGISRLLVTLACLGFLGLVVWGVMKLMA